MKKKTLISPDRRRRIPDRFSWIDHRLVKDGHFKNCSHGSLALYLFLVVVGDSDGMSYYGAGKLCEYLNCSHDSLTTFRQELIDAGLIAYESPLYQVLELNPATYDRSFFTEVLRDAVKKQDSKRESSSLINMYSPHWRKPENWRPVQKIGTVIENIIGGE